MEQKESGASEHVEVRDQSNASEAGTPPQQETTMFMIFFSLYIGIAALIYNFDLGYSGIVLLMQPYNDAFGVCTMIKNPKNPSGPLIQHCAVTALQQSLISVTILFIALGGALGGITGAYLGRRGAIQVGCVLIAIGAGGMCGTAGNFTAYMACKCIGGVGLGHIIAATPSYGVECVSAGKRGFLMALFNFGLGIGNMLAAAVCLATSTYTTNLAWQTPILCQIPLAFLLGFGVLMFPESPRWLLVSGKEEAARKSFARFYNKDPYSLEIERQVQEVLHYIELEKQTGKTTNWTEIFYGVDRRRTLLAVLVSVGLAITGSKFISTYAAIFLAGVGVGSPYVVTLLVASCATIGAIPSPWIVEYGGRRFALLTGYAFMAVFMLIIGAVGTGLGAANPISKNVLVAFLCIWAITFGAFIGPSLGTTAPEMHSVRLRTYGHAASTMCYEVFSFAASFYTPYMLSAQYGNMGLNVGYFYFGVTTVVWIMVFIWVPETMRLTLEQLDDYFISGRPAWRTSKTRNLKISRGEYAGDVGDDKEKIAKLHAVQTTVDG